MSIEEYFDLCKDSLFESEEKAEEVKTYFLQKAGFQKMAIGEKGKLIAMFEHLIQVYLKEQNVNPQEINYIYYTDTLTVYTDDMKCIPLEIQSKFQFLNASVVEINQQCASCIWTIGMASRMLKKGEKALLLTANMMSGLNERYKPHSVIGDGVAIMELSGDSGNIDIIDYDFKTKEYIGEVGFNNNLDMMKSCVKSMENVVKRNGMEKDDLSYVIHQNLSKEIYEIIFTILFGINEEKMFWDNIKDKAHVGDADLVVNLCDLMKNREVKTGDVIMLFAIGEVFSSANYNCILLKVNESLRKC
jgi:3-oxoacyl-[acyl-carrier-protein] synthase III